MKLPYSGWKIGFRFPLRDVSKDPFSRSLISSGFILYLAKVFGVCLLTFSPAMETAEYVILLEKEPYRPLVFIKGEELIFNLHYRPSVS
jgi:hypothetical protein